MSGQHADVDRSLHTQGTPERLAANCLLEATRHGVQPRTSPRHPVSRVRAEHHRGGLPSISVRRRDHSQQCRPAIRSATSHTGARWLGAESSPVGHTQVYRVERPTCSTDLRTSLQRGVSGARLHSRACPALPAQPRPHRCDQTAMACRSPRTGAAYVSVGSPGTGGSPASPGSPPARCSACHRRSRCRGGCRCASRSASPRGGRSGPPCRWPGSAGSRGR